MSINEFSDFFSLFLLHLEPVAETFKVYVARWTLAVAAIKHRILLACISFHADSTAEVLIFLGSIFEWINDWNCSILFNRFIFILLHKYTIGCEGTLSCFLLMWARIKQRINVKISHNKLLLAEFDDILLLKFIFLIINQLTLTKTDELFRTYNLIGTCLEFIYNKIEGFLL